MGVGVDACCPRARGAKRVATRWEGRRKGRAEGRGRESDVSRFPRLGEKKAERKESSRSSTVWKFLINSNDPGTKR